MPSITMDFQNAIQLLAKSLGLLGFSVSPKSWTISQNGSEVHLNIKFGNTSTKSDCHTLASNCETIYRRKKSPSTIKRDQKRRQVFINKMRTAANTASDTSHLNTGSNQLNADTPALPGTSGGNSSQQHLELIELQSNPDNMDMSHNYVETICFDDEISEELYEVDTVSALPFYDCDNNEISDVINPVNSILDDLKQTKHKLQIMNKQLKYQDSSCPDPSSSQSMEQETLRALLDLTKTELLSQKKIRELSRELEESQMAQEDAMSRVTSAENDLQRLKHRYGPKGDDERRYERGTYDFGAIRNGKHQYKQDCRHQYYSSKDDYSYRHGKSRPEFQPVMEKCHRKYW